MRRRDWRHPLDDNAIAGCSRVWHVSTSETAGAELTDFHARFALAGDVLVCSGQQADTSNYPLP